MSTGNRPHPRRADKPTWRMTTRELTRTYATVRGYTGRRGGWIYGPDGRPVCQGWAAFTAYLTRTGRIRPGVGINWAADHRTT